MKKFALIFVHLACAFLFFTVACSNPVKKQTKGQLAFKGWLH